MVRFQSSGCVPGDTFPGEGGVLLTVEQLMILALQRCKTARGAILLIGELAERYGFLGSCADEGESLSIADPHEAWIMELLNVGGDWKLGSGPGAIWVARRVSGFVNANLTPIRRSFRCCFLPC